VAAAVAAAAFSAGSMLQFDICAVVTIAIVLPFS
jgi:hypothetical protein